MKILGISCFYHDSAAAILVDGQIVAAAQEERFTRKKHDSAFPKNAVEFCLEYAGIKIEELDYVAFYDKPFTKFERILETYLSFAPSGIGSFIKAVPVWLKEKLWISQIIPKHLPGFKGEYVYPEHHQSHAASAFFPSPFEQAAFITVDGVGEWTTTSFGTGQGNSFQIDSHITFPHSLGLLYSAFTYYLGFRVNSGEYKVMGLAPYGEPVYYDLIMEKLIDLKADGSFRLNMDYFNYCTGLTMTNRRFSDLFGRPPRQPETQLEQFHMDMAASVQKVTQEAVLRMARFVREKTGMKNLCLAGGVALNCVANGKIIEEGIFDNVWIQPAAGDAGGALGAAFCVWFDYLKNPRILKKPDLQQGSLLGPSYTSAQVKAYLDENNIEYEELEPENVYRHVAGLLADQKIVGWFAGRMEFGPRALGARSIIGDARSSSMQSDINLKVKYRESFRPFAPAVLKEDMGEWFELEQDSPYMLVVADVKAGKLAELTPEQQKMTGLSKLKVPRSSIPAVTHVDNSARIQSVSPESNEPFYRLISEFKKITGCPVLINTSFNVRGEPLVCSPKDAYTCFMRTQIDYLVLENFLIDKTRQPEMEHPDEWRKEYVLD